MTDARMIELWERDVERQALEHKLRVLAGVTAATAAISAAAAVLAAAAHTPRQDGGEGK